VIIAFHPHDPHEIRQHPYGGCVATSVGPG
jgi:hypothetical protein